MANTGFGLRFSRTLHGGAPLTQRFYVPSTDGTALYKGDIAMLVTTTGAMDSAGEYPVITAGVSGDVILGVIDGFKADGSNPLSGNYRAASTARYVDVIVDPDAVYTVQEDGVGGAATAAQVGAMNNFSLIVAAGSTVTGLSGTMLDSSTPTTSAADVKVVGVPANGGGNYAAITGGGVLEVMILAPAIKATASHS